jgi:predicted metal-dependent phosphotriesterase family hydrolase
MHRRKFLRDASLLAGSLLVIPSVLALKEKQSQWMSVLGPVKSGDLGITLIHEHIMADFIGAAETGSHRYDANKVVEKALPYLIALKKAGCSTFIDCTPVYLGRDASILKRLAQASGLNIFTTTGYYGAVKQKFLPAHAYTETAEQLAARWINEWKNGIDSTGVYPGLIKTSVDEGPLPPVCKKILAAVAIAHLQTGLSISAHTGNGEAALEELSILQKGGVHPSAFRWVHAQFEKDKTLHLRAAKMGAWIEFDGINSSEPGNIQQHVEFVKNMKDHGYLNQTLISQDAGWYWVGEPDGGKFRGYTDLFEKFIPALKEAGFSDDEVKQLLVENTKESLRVKVRNQ